MSPQSKRQDQMLDVKEAASIVGCHPETVRRWVWSGRLRAQRRGRNLIVARSELEALAGDKLRAASLSDWYERVRSQRRTVRGRYRASAADLVLKDRASRS